MQPENTKVHVYHGAAETNEFWDVILTPLQLSYAEVETEDMRGFSMFLDLKTGGVSLNEGYAPGSQPYREERSMFAEFDDSAVEALLEHVKGRTGDFGPFVQVAEEDREARLNRLEDLAIDLDEHEAGMDENEED